MTNIVTAEIVKKATKNIAKSSLVNTIRDSIVDLLEEQSITLGKKEISDQIVKLRSDAKLRQQIQDASNRAVRRWAEDCPDRDLVNAIAVNTGFIDLPSVQTAVRAVAQRPFDPQITMTLQGSFNDVLPESFDKERVERGVILYMEVLREEFAGISLLRETLQTFASIKTAEQTIERLKKIMRLLEWQRNRHTQKAQVIIDGKTTRIIAMDFAKGSVNDFQMFKNS